MLPDELELLVAEAASAPTTDPHFVKQMSVALSPVFRCLAKCVPEHSGQHGLAIEGISFGVSRSESEPEPEARLQTDTMSRTLQNPLAVNRQRRTV